MATFVSKQSLKLKKKFTASIPLMVHQDRKILVVTSGSKTGNRFSAVVSGKGTDQLFPVSKLQSSTDEEIASAVNETLESWGLQRR